MTATTELLGELIRSECVNDGSPESGHESRNADLIESYLSGSGIDVERYGELPGRDSLVARIEGSDPSAPTLLLMGHTDVVPVNPAGWERDPFGGELVDDVVWGRGAVDMLNHTASMAVALRRLAESGFRPRGTLAYLAVADEEGGGSHGAEWLLEHHRDAVAADYVITETGGMSVPLGEDRRRVAVMTGEKGVNWLTLTVRGTAGHASMPTAGDNALVRAAEVVRRIAEHQPETKVDGLWETFVRGAELPGPLTDLLLDPGALDEFVAAEGVDPGLALLVRSATRMTIAPTLVSGGTKINVIPDEVEISLDIRALPGQRHDDVVAEIEQVLGPDLLDRVEIGSRLANDGNESSPDTPLWDTLERATGALVPGALLTPFLMVGITDARFFRRAGSTAYGYGLFSERISLREFASMFHGDNERIDVESLELATDLWEAVARDFLG